MIQQIEFLQTGSNVLVSKNDRLKSKIYFTLLVAMTAFVLSLPLTPVHAQNSLDPAKLTAVVSVINSYLLDTPNITEIEVNFNQVDKQTYLINDNFEIEFPRVTQNIEFCFLITTFDRDLRLTINGDDRTLTAGENCFYISSANQSDTNSVQFSFANGSGIARISIISVAPNNPRLERLSSLKRSEWDERAVRKVLKIFAFGGHAQNSQISLWANMRPYDAIREMLNFDQHNFRLSSLNREKYVEHARGALSVDVPGYINGIEVLTAETVKPGTLYGWQQYLRARNTNYPVPSFVPNDGNPYYPRDQYGVDGYNFDDGFNRMVTVRGLNPFRQRIGFWETNYHLATNLDANVSRRQMAIYYDEIMQAHEDGLPYKDVMAVAAKSAAVAMQYAHRNNRWNSSTGECECNEDFAREIHQLFYGIFGDYDPIPSDGISGPDYHENITIPNTAKMLTDMRVPYLNDDDNAGFTGFDIKVTFQTAEHHVSAVTILGQVIRGFNASAKIDALMPISMQHPESLENLPVMIISALANDNLTDANKTELRTSWAGMGVDRNFLDFIRAYAISDQFHSATQFKYLTSHERALYIANKHNLENIESYFGGGYYNGGRAGRTVGSVIQDDFAGDFFRPIHNVFGGQTSSEASDSSLVFENNYNRLTDNENHIRDAVQCQECDLGNPWQKKWENVLPRRGGNYYVADVAEWLWNHAVGNMDNYTELERAHLYTLLGAARDIPGNYSDGAYAFDFNLMMCVMADYDFDDQGFMSGNATITDILADNSKWNDYCRGDGGFYEPHELAELNAQYTSEQIADSPEIQAILTELGNETIPLNASGESHSNDGLDLRRNTRGRISGALGFIFTTPFVFAEGQ